MEMDDDGEKDDKVIAVPDEDPRYDDVTDVEDLSDQQKAEVAEFFETYKNLEAGKETEVLGWQDADAAKDAIEHAQDLYDEHFA